MRNVIKIKIVYLYIFVDVSNLVCCVVVIVVVEYSEGMVKGFFILKLRIFKRDIIIVRLELVGG